PLRRLPARRRPPAPQSWPRPLAAPGRRRTAPPDSRRTPSRVARPTTAARSTPYTSPAATPGREPRTGEAAARSRVDPARIKPDLYQGELCETKALVPDDGM